VITTKGKPKAVPSIPRDFELHGHAFRDGTLFAIGARGSEQELLAWKSGVAEPLVQKAALRAKKEDDPATPALMGVIAVAGGGAWVWGFEGYLAHFDGTKLTREKSPCDRILRVSASEDGGLLLACEVATKDGFIRLEGTDEPWDPHFVSLYESKPGGAHVAITMPDLKTLRYAQTPRMAFVVSNVYGPQIIDIAPEVLSEGAIDFVDGFVTRDGTKWAIAYASTQRVTYVFSSKPAKEITSLDHMQAVRENEAPPKPLTKACETVFIALGEASEASIAKVQRDPALAEFIHPLVVGRVRDKTLLGVLFLTFSYTTALEEAKKVQPELKKRGLTPELLCVRPLVEKIIPDLPQPPAPPREKRAPKPKKPAATP